MNAPARNFSEPAETTANDPINGMLDLFEAQAKLLIAHGGESAVRARLARLLPAPSNSRSASRPEGAEHLSTDDKLLAVSGASVLRQLAKLRKSGAARSQIEAIAALLMRLAHPLQKIENANGASP